MAIAGRMGGQSVPERRAELVPTRPRTHTSGPLVVRWRSAAAAAPRSAGNEPATGGARRRRGQRCRGFLRARPFLTRLCKCRPHPAVNGLVRGNNGPGRGAGAVRGVRLGIWSGMGAIAVFSFAVVLPGRERLPFPVYLAIALPATALALAFAIAPPGVIPGPNRSRLFYAWSLMGVGLISGTVALTGGGRSDLYLLYTVSLLFAANFYVVRAQVVLGLITAGAYTTTVAATGWHISLSVFLVRISVMALVTLMAGYMAAEKDRIAAESARRASLLAAVTTAARYVNVLEPSQVLQAVTEALGHLGLGWGQVALIDEETATYRIVHGVGVPREYANATPPASAGIVGMVREARATVHLDVESAANYVVPVLDARSNFTAILGSPLWVDGPWPAP